MTFVSVEGAFCYLNHESPLNLTNQINGSAARCQSRWLPWIFGNSGFSGHCISQGFIQGWERVHLLRVVQILHIWDAKDAQKLMLFFQDPGCLGKLGVLDTVKAPLKIPCS